MILREIFSYAGVDDDNKEDYRYEPEYDQSVVDLDDTRKTRLTLQQINRARKASELHDKEKTNEIEFVRKMYGIAAQAPPTGL